MWYILGLFVIGIIGLIIKIYWGSSEIDEKLNRKNRLKQLILDNTQIQGKTFIDEESTKAIVIDDQNKKIHLFSLIENKCLVYNFEDVIQSEVVIDNNTIITTNRGQQLLGGVVGGLIAGVPGVIIGALSSSKIQTEKIKNVELKLTLNDIDNSIFKISFLNQIAVNKGLSKDFYMIKNALNEVEIWQGYFNVIMK
jgi:hypothetical protein